MAPETGNARLPTVERRTGGTPRRCEVEDRSRLSKFIRMQSAAVGLQFEKKEILFFFHFFFAYRPIKAFTSYSVKPMFTQYIEIRRNITCICRQRGKR